jgi:hypothetical protein
MTSLNVQIFKAGRTEPETRITISLAVPQIALKLMPKSLRSKLEEEEIDLNELAALIEKEEVRGTLMEIENPEEKLVISID